MTYVAMKGSFPRGRQLVHAVSLLDAPLSVTVVDDLP
jgi:hypothetical protein